MATTMLATSQTMCCAERGIGALTMAVAGCPRAADANIHRDVKHPPAQSAPRHRSVNRENNRDSDPNGAISQEKAGNSGVRSITSGENSLFCANREKIGR